MISFLPPATRPDDLGRRKGRPFPALCAVLAVAVWLVSLPAYARVTRIEITHVESPTFEGLSFGAVGPYEKLVGRAIGEVDPSDPRNAVIVDIGLAPRNAKGMVEYSTDVYILRPVDPSKGNHRLLFDINNRGDARLFTVFNDSARVGNNPTTAADTGNGFLMRQGYTMLWTGWDATVSAGNGRFTITVPVIRNADGSPIVGSSLEEFAIDNDTTTVGRLTYPAVSLDTSQAELMMRVRYEDAPTAVPATSWEYAGSTSIRLLPAGTPFKRGHLYTLVYPAKDPIVAGLGFAAIRDAAEFFHYGAKDEGGGANPLAGDIRFVYSYCSSQPCRTMRDFVHLGFNQDGAGRRAFDGVLNWIGGASGVFMNYRFAKPGTTHRQHIGRWSPEFEFPFANQVLFDPVTGKTDGRLRRCLATNTCPKIFEVNSENEYWAKSMSVLHLDGEGNDLEDAPGVRSYLLASFPHGPGAGPGICQQPRNPLTPSPSLRALLTALDEWVSSGKEPPASRLPRRSDGTLVAALPQSSVGFPNIPGVRYNGRLHTGDWLDFGSKFDRGILTVLPPSLRGTPYPALVPKTDADGNDIAGIRVPDVAVPLATYTGWGLRAFPPGADDGCDAAGQKIDFKKTKAEREAAGDPRLSIEERYPSHADYVRRVNAAAAGLQQQRLLLAEDVERVVKEAESRAKEFMK